jgi:hypothetical protein
MSSGGIPNDASPFVSEGVGVPDSRAAVVTSPYGLPGSRWKQGAEPLAAPAVWRPVARAPRGGRRYTSETRHPVAGHRTSGVHVPAARRTGAWQRMSGGSVAGSREVVGESG